MNSAENRINVTQAKTYYLAAGLLFISVVANAALVPLVPYLLATRNGWPLWQVGLYSASVTATTILVTVVTSRLVDQGRSLFLVCTVGGLCQALAGISAGLAMQNVAALVPLVVTLAIGGAVVPVFYAMGRRLGDLIGDDPAHVNSVLRIATSAGWVVGPGVSFWLLGVFTDNAALGLVTALALLGVLSLLLTRRMVSTQPSNHGGAPAQHVGRQSSSVGRRIRFASAVVAMFSFMHIVTTTSLALLIVDAKGIPESSAGWIIGFKALLEMVAIFLSRKVLARHPINRVLISCALLAIVSYGVYFVGSGWLQVAIAAGAEGFYYGLFAAVGLTWVQSIEVDRIGRTTGAYMTGIYTGTLVGAPVSGIVATASLPAITLVSTFVGVVILATLLLRGRRSEADIEVAAI